MRDLDKVASAIPNSAKSETAHGGSEHAVLAMSGEPQGPPRGIGCEHKESTKRLYPSGYHAT